MIVSSSRVSLLLLAFASMTDAFLPLPSSRGKAIRILYDSTDANNNDKDPSFMDKVNARNEKIQVEKARTALEDANTQSFLKRRPRKLPYEDSRMWVQANWGCDSKEEFDDLVANGNLRTPYIPKNPEEYYTFTREWISWDHFLKGCFDGENPSAMKPQTGVFD